MYRQCGRSIRGGVDIPRFVKMLRKVNYNAVVALEHERNKDDSFMGIAV